MGLGPRRIDKPPAASGPFGLGFQPLEFVGWGFNPLNLLPDQIPTSTGLPPSIAACDEAEHEEEAWLFRRGFRADPAPFLLICMQPALLLGALVVELHAAAQRPNKCLPSSLPWYTATVGSMGSLLEDKINFWVMHIGRNNLNETRTLLGYKLTVTTEEKRYGHRRAQLLTNLRVFSCSVHQWSNRSNLKWCWAEWKVVMKLPVSLYNWVARRHP